MMDISFVIPVFNESENIQLLLNKLNDISDRLSLRSEIIFVNDGSSDNSIDIIHSLAASNNNVKFIDLSRNFGHQVAVTAGLDHCKGDAVVIMDADLQDPPELVEQLYNKFKEGFDVVYAKRINREGEGVMKKFTARIFYRLLSTITSVEIPVDTGDFRIISSKVVDVIRRMPEQEKFLRGQIAWVGFKQSFVEYNRDARAKGKTGYSYSKMMKFALDGITSFSNFPLRFATVAGFIVSGIAFVLILWALYSRFISRDFVQGWTSLILTVLFMGGIQLIGIGIIGEYISRISANVRKRPLYIIKESNVERED
ncbi:MAG: glycosyltransferase family 2 protein [Bacteroidia bacterium]|nr:glycosyltransferase family 2 protein [Bacteroidia bacterium]